MIPAKLDTRLKSVADDLLAAGWSERRVIDHHVNGDLVVVFGKGRLEVYLIHERGTPDIEVQPVGWTTGASPSVWCKAFGIAFPPREDPLENQTTALAASLARIGSAIEIEGLNYDTFLELLERRLGIGEEND